MYWKRLIIHFITNMVNSLSSSSPKTMFVFRLASFLLLLVLVSYSLATDEQYSFIYLTFYGILFTWILFGLILLHYRVETVLKMIEESIVPIWLLNFFITMYYWIFLSDSLEDSADELLASIFEHSIPFITSSAELFTNRVIAKKIHILYAIVVFSVYILCINLPYTLEEEEIYEDVNYTNSFSYLAAVGAIVFFIVFGFAICHIKTKILEMEKEPEEELLKG